jgi:cytochrome c oxidase subunit 3
MEPRNMAATSTIEENRSLPVANSQLVLWWFLATVTMLFAAFASSYLVRRGSDPSWKTIQLPAFVWVNTAVLIVSSITLELARRQRRRGWLVATTAVGVAFLAGQVHIWNQLAADGVFLPTRPHGSFFYILSGLHGAHLLGGIVLLGYALMSSRAQAVQNAATYWHFLTALWLGVLALVTLA